MSAQFHLFVVSILMSCWIGCTGIFIPFFVAACCVQRERLSKRRGINYVMAFATAFFGLTVTTVSEGDHPRNTLGNSSNACPVEFRHIALPGCTIDLDLGNGGPHESWSTISRRVDRLVWGTLSPDRGCGRNNSTSSIHVLCYWR